MEPAVIPTAVVVLVWLVLAAAQGLPTSVWWMGVLCFVRSVWLWYTRPSDGARLVREVDLDPEEEIPNTLTTRAARMAAYAFKAEFGEMRYNKANRLIAGDWVRKHFRDGGMRYVDIARHMDIAVELCLLPTSSAATAAELARTREVRARRAAVDHAK